MKHWLSLVGLLICLGSAGAQGADTEEAPAPKLRTDLRGDPLPLGASARMGSARLRHSQPLNSLAFGMGGETILSTSRNGSGRMWAAADGKPVGEFESSSAGIRSASVEHAADRYVLATASGADVRDLKTLESVAMLGSDVNFARISPDGAHLAAFGSDGVLRLIDVDSGAELLAISEDGHTVNSFSFSARGDRLIVCLINRNKRLGRKGTADQPVVRIQLYELKGELTASDVREIELADAFVTSVEFVAGGETFVGAGPDGALLGWSFSDAKALEGLAGTGVNCANLTCSPDGNKLALGMESGRVRVVDVSTDKWAEQLVFDPSYSAGAPIAFSPDGKRLVVGTGLGAGIWDALSGAPIFESASHRGPVTAVAFTPDGSGLVSVSSDRYLRQWNAKTGEPGWSHYAHTDWISDVSISGDGELIATASRDGRVHLWASDGAQLSRLVGHTGAVTGVSVAPDGSSVASVSADKTLISWDPRDGSVRHRVEGLAGVLFGVRHLPSGEAVAVSGTELALFRDADGTRTQTQRNAEASITALAVAGDGRRAALGLASRSLYLVDFESGERVLSFDRHAGRITSIAFGPDAHKLASASYGAPIVRIWDAEDGAELAKIEGLGSDPTSLAISPDGQSLAVGCLDGSLLIWDLPTSS